MRVAFVCPYDWASHGGVRAHVEQLADHLSGAHDVRVLAPSSAPLTDPRVEVIGRPVSIRFNDSVAPVAVAPRSGHRVLAALRAWGPDLTHVHEPLAPMLSVAATGWAPRPLVGTFHAWSDHDRLYRASSPVARRLAARLDSRIAVSAPAQAYACAALGMAPEAFTILPNGVDAERFSSARPFPQLRDPARPLLLFVGRLEPRKGLDVALRAFVRLRAEVADVRLCVVGDGPERTRCERIVPAELRDDVVFTGRVSAEDLPRYHASADVLLAPATGGESFGIVLLEGMAAGLPVIASAIPGYASVLTDGRQGFLVPPRDAFALASAIRTLLADPQRRQAMAAQGRRTAAAHAWPVLGERIAALYRTVVDR